MKHKTLRRLLLAACLLGTLAAAAPADAGMPFSHRRTLFAGVGQKTIMLEAPTNMCFLDGTQYSDRQVMQFVEQRLQHSRARAQPIGIFVDCYTLARLAGIQPGEEVMFSDFGIVAWANPYIGETSPLMLEDYLDLRGKLIESEVRAVRHALKNFQYDQTPLRTSHGMVYTFETETEIEFRNMVSRGAIGMMLVGKTPIDISISHTAPKPTKTRDELRALVEKFMAQQVYLNPR